MSTPELTARARAWAAEDPDEQTRAELERLLAETEADPDGAAAATWRTGSLVVSSSARRACAARSGPGPTG